ncbi:unnamed protein product [Periconia digitata]|uniref:RING-type domain-containing protein n=1 Tax=Periconia digitata TaxID=1303443 RepID=A0A9W4XTU8_9PLEO|nr:unnamed protein product [Periconia digitata]
MAEDSPAPVDLEKELSCSICTDLLYQPLTLLDCLHTFCGACLKEWFVFQASTATSLHPYTCPSCRASVRSTRPNATVTTLLDIFVQANPHRGKSEEDKKSDRGKFKYGDNVLPKLRRRGGEEQDEDDRRMMESVQQLSLQEVGIEPSSGRNNLEPPRERRRRERSREARNHSSDMRRSRDEGRSASRSATATPSSRDAVPPRVVEHQSSLRSLLSASELDSQEMEEEIMRQIMEDGLLDGIDLNNIDVAQEDEISERIAQAYRRRQTQRQRERRERRERLARDGQINSGYSTPPEIRSPPARDDEQRRRPQGRPESGTSTPRDRERSNRPPISRPGLLDVANQGAQPRHARSSSQGSSRSARSEHRPAPLAVSSRQTPSQSQTDLGTRRPDYDSPNPGRRRQSDNQQHSTLAERQQFRNSVQTSSSSNPSSPRRAAFNVTAAESVVSNTAVVASPISSPLANTPPISSPGPVSNSRRTTDPVGLWHSRRTGNGTPPAVNPSTLPRATTDPSTAEAQARPNTLMATVSHSSYLEPHIVCRSCNKDHLEYELHYNCSRCDEGAFNLCQPCYRAGRGCKHWYGFGWAAWPAYQKRSPPGGYPPSYEYPHIMRGHRFRRPQSQLKSSNSHPGRLKSEDEPSHRLEEGVFCDMCSAWANACYWKCDYCNEGEWGYCNDCVNQGRHCTHALLPITHIVNKKTPPPSAAPAADPPSTPHLTPSNVTNESTTSPPLTPKSASVIGGPGEVTLANSIYRPLTFTVLCNMCTYPIPPSHTRYHCSTCNDGDYDICSPCYKKLVLVGRIKETNGMNGWRRCLRGHRMIVVGFEDRDGGQRRVVVRSLVGGVSLREDESSSSHNQDTSFNNSGNNTPSTTTTNEIPSSMHREEKWTWREHDGSRQHASSVSATTPSAPHTSQRRYPPDGGVGLRLQARWSYYPAPDANDELLFPKFAEITEAEDINGDWFWGVYAGSKGLFPGGYGRIIGGNAERQGLV